MCQYPQARQAGYQEYAVARLIGGRNPEGAADLRARGAAKDAAARGPSTQALRPASENIKTNVVGGTVLGGGAAGATSETSPTWGKTLLGQ